MFVRLSAYSPKFFMDNGRKWLDRHRLLCWQLLIVGGALFLSMALPIVAPRRFLPLLAALVLAAPGFLTLQRYRGIGLILILLSLVLPFNGPSGSNATMAVVAMLVGLWLLDVISFKRRITIFKSPTLLPLLCLVVISILSFGMGQLPWYAFGQTATMGAQVGGLAIVLLSAAAFLLVAGQVRSLSLLEGMVWVFLAISAVHVAAWLVPGLDRLIKPWYYGVIAGSLFWTWGAILAFSQAMFNQRLRWPWRLALLLLAMLIIYIGYALNGDWKSGWVPPVIGIATIAALRYWPWPLALAPFAMIPAARIIETLIESDAYSYGTRVDAWLIVLEISKANPLLGLGFANYNAYTPLFPIRGYAVRFNSHSQYVDLIAQQGVLGLICFLWFFAAVAWVGWRLRNRVQNGFAKAYVYGALGGVAATLVAAALGDWVLPFFYNVGMNGFRSSVLSWIFLGGLVALEQMYSANGIANPAAASSVEVSAELAHG